MSRIGGGVVDGGGKRGGCALELFCMVLALVPATAGGATTVAMSRQLDGVTMGDDHTYPDAMTPDGLFFVLDSDADNLVPGQSPTDNSQLFLYERISKTIRLISHAAGSPTTPSNSYAYAPRLSDDGRFVAFESEADDLVAGMTDHNGGTDVFLWDSATDTTVLVSRSDASALDTVNDTAFLEGFSSDGRFVLWTSGATDLPGVTSDDNFGRDLILSDRLGAPRLVSHATGGSATTTANHASNDGALSADGNWVVARSGATNLAAGVTDTNGVDDVFLWERSAAPMSALQLLSRSRTSAATTQSGHCNAVAIAPAAAWVGFVCGGGDVEGTTVDENGADDLFQFDRAANVVRLVSRAASSPTVTAEGEAGDFSSSATGELVTYESKAFNVVPSQVDLPGTQDLFLWTRTGSVSTLISHAHGQASTTADGESAIGGISADGAFIAFDSAATDLVSGLLDTNGDRDVFRWTRASGVQTLLSHVVESTTVTGSGGSGLAQISADGSRVSFYTSADDVVPVDGNESNDAVYSGPDEIFTDGFGRGTALAWSNVAP